MSNKLKVRVYHAGYGCESGCCGHIVEVGDKIHKFNFDHPYSEDEKDLKKWAKKLAEEVIREEHPSCINNIDWDSMEVKVSND